MDKERVVKMFNNKFTLFLDDLSKLFPQDQTLFLLKNSFRVLTTFDEKKAISIFDELVTQKYEKQIMSKDESFFLQHDYDDIKNYDQNVTADLIQDLKNHWGSFNEENKEIVWKYMILLVSLDKKYQELRKQN